MPTILESLNACLHRAMEADARVYILGEDILDPYGGAFKVTRGLSTAFPERVLTTPVSEAGIAGVAAGMALRGLRPVAEIMFGDFITLAADQLINHISKFRWMYNDQVNVPLVMRVPMGGRRGYGPTHSQSLEKLYLGVPGLRVLAPCSLGGAGALLYNAILDDDDPVLFIENKLLYLADIQNEANLEDFRLSKFSDQEATSSQNSPQTSRTFPLSPASYPPTYLLSLREAPPPILTMTTYGHMVELAQEAVVRLAYEHEIFTELVVPTQLAPVELQPLFSSVGRTHRLLVLEEGTLTLGWGAEVLARTVEALEKQPPIGKRVAAADAPIPASGPLEAALLPDVDDIVRTAREMVQAR
jgi:pyruvate/2-oxoglutarate/acetoin dehydrogenase E1 component